MQLVTFSIVVGLSLLLQMVCTCVCLLQITMELVAALGSYIPYTVVFHYNSLGESTIFLCLNLVPFSCKIQPNFEA